MGDTGPWQVSNKVEGTQSVWWHLIFILGSGTYSLDLLKTFVVSGAILAGYHLQKHVSKLLNWRPQAEDQEQNKVMWKSLLLELESVSKIGCVSSSEL